jgi:hypothetical protein
MSPTLRGEIFVWFGLSETFSKNRWTVLAAANSRLESGQESDYKTSANRSSSRALKPRRA